MNFRHAILIAVPVLAAMSYGTYLQLQPAEVIAPGRSAVPVDSSAALTSERGTGTNGADLAALKGDVASLSADIMALRHQIATQGASGPSRVNAPAAPDVRAEPISRTEADRAHLAQVDTVDAAFRQQVVDPSWSANTTSTIREALNSADVGGLQADTIDCRSSSCRVELHDDGTGRMSKSLPMLAQQLAGSMPTITANTIPQGNGTSNVVLYMSRDGDEQPPPR